MRSEPAQERAVKRAAPKVSAAERGKPSFGGSHGFGTSSGDDRF